MNHTPHPPTPTQILQYLQWLENKDPLDPKPNNILKKKGPGRNLKLMETLKNCKL